MTTKGKYLEQGAPSVGKVDPGGDGANPGVIPETPKEEGWWKKASPWVHGVLGVASFVPGLSVVTGAADAAIYAGEGNLVEAGIAAASMIPGGKVVTTVGKVGKAAVGLAKEAGVASKLMKGAHEAEEMAKAAKLAKEAEEAAKAAKAAKEAQLAKEAKEAKDAADAAKKAKKAKKGDKDTTVKSKKPQKPHKDCGKVGKYSSAPKKLGELNADHIPSGAALKAFAERQLKEMKVWQKLSDKQRESVLNKVYNNAPTITIPEDVHKEGRTWGSKNNQTQISADSKDLKGAFEKDAKAIQKSMDSKDHGCSDVYKKAVKELRNFDYEKYIEKAIKEHKAVKGLI